MIIDVDLYKELSSIDLTDESNKFNLLKYQLIEILITDLEKPHNKGFEFRAGGWMFKYFYTTFTIHHNTLKITPNQWHDLITWMFYILPNVIKIDPRLGYSESRFHAMVDRDIEVRS